jgi:Ca2+-binding EF-hand superfamily protein
MDKVFRIYDNDDNGTINAVNLEACALDLEETLTKQETNEMIRMGDKDKKDYMNKDDFMVLMEELGLWGSKKE